MATSIAICVLVGVALPACGGGSSTPDARKAVTTPTSECGAHLVATDQLRKTCGQKARQDSTVDAFVGLNLATVGYPVVYGSKFTDDSGAPVIVGTVCSSTFTCEGFFVGQHEADGVLIKDVIDIRASAVSATADFTTTLCRARGKPVIAWYSGAQPAVVFALRVHALQLTQVPPAETTCKPLD